jgi:hypothetical protein
MWWAWKSLKEVASDECYVEARVVVSAPGTLANAATTNTPDLGRSLGLSVGWETAMNSVVGVYVFAMKATLGGVAFKDVQDVKAMTKEETTKA